jgi:hypothetical protein
MKPERIDAANVSVLKPSPLIELEAEYRKYEAWPPYIGTTQVAQIFGCSPQGAGQMHQTIERLSAGYNDAGHLLFRKDIAIALSYFKRLRSGDNDNGSEPASWDSL